ncbi:DUF4292 domain-containing protein [bacterium]|nr:DUF4292 domain-containing protein [bacterium]
MSSYIKRSGIFILAGFIFILGGCAGLKQTLPLKPATPGRIIPQVERHNAKIKTFSGRAVMTMRGEDMRSFRATMHIMIKRPDSLWFKMEGPLGLDIATGHFGQGHGQVYVPFEGYVYRGSVERLQAMDVLPLDLPLTELMMGFVGLPVPSVPASDSLMTISVLGRQYHLAYTYGEDILVDPIGPVVTRWEKRDAYGDPLWLWRGEAFYKIKGIRLPKTILISQYHPRQQISLTYNTMKPNVKLKPSWFKIKMPEGVKIIEL